MASLRERNKLRTRELISDVATRLFLEHGFEAITIAEVAAAAGVAKMTVTNHFPRKEDLVLDLHEELVAGPARAVGARSAGESALDALRRHFLEALDRYDPALGFSGAPFAAMLLGSPALLARLREIHEERERALADVLIRETRPAPGDPMPRLAAGQMIAIYRVLLHEALCLTARGVGQEEVHAYLAGGARSAFSLLAPGLGDYARR
ncbi:TetR/AcrR family transcriptional regulator [Streptosporangium sp. DT93]|uniref:TetR/AcrR family transcriptional regulator n=1 Tax=Streptosporangium sp. DT93 TaxID=3393428 RepID=UPI003CF862DC